MFKNLMIKGAILFPIFLFLAVFVVFWPITKSFYQQDEWASLGSALVYGPKFIWQSTSGPVQFLLGQGRVLSNVFNYLLFSGHPFNLIYVFLFGIIWHALNTVLVFFLARKFIKSFPAVVLASVFFAFNSVAQQAVIWPSTIVNTLPSTTLVILSIFSFMKYLEGKSKWLSAAFLFLYASLFFKESGVCLFLLFPIFGDFYLKLTFQKFLKSFWLFILFITLTVVARLWQFGNISSAMNLFVTGSTPNYLFNIFLRLIYYPLTSLSLTYLPAQSMLALAKIITRLYYSFIPANIVDLVAQSVVLDGMAIFFSLSLVILFITCFKGNNEKKHFFLLLGIFIFSFLPYAIITKNFAYLESRYYYLASVPAAILLGMFWQKLFSFKKGIVVLSIFVFVVFLKWHITSISGELSRQLILANQRKAILDEVTKVRPSLDDKTVFYFTGGRNYYIDEGNNLPLQQGLGYTLAVWYYGKNRAYSNLQPLIKDQFLWDLGSQGYREVYGKGFGCFWQIADLKKEIKAGRFKKEDVFGFDYDSNKMVLKNITQEVRGLL